MNTMSLCDSMMNLHGRNPLLAEDRFEAIYVVEVLSIIEKHRHVAIPY